MDNNLYKMADFTVVTPDTNSELKRTGVVIIK